MEPTTVEVPTYYRLVCASQVRGARAFAEALAEALAMLDGDDEELGQELFENADPEQ